MAATTLLAALESIVREELPATSTESLNITDPIYPYLAPSSRGVRYEPSGRIGRNWNIMHRFKIGVSGLIEPTVNTGGSVYAAALRTQQTNTPTGFPNISNNQHVVRFIRQIFLAEHRGNFSIDLYTLKAEALNAAVLQTVPDDIEGVAKQLAHHEATSFYVGKYLGYNAGAATLGSAPNGGTNNNLTFSDLTGHRMGYFKTGMMVDLYDDSSLSNKLNVKSAVDVPLVVDIVDPLEKTLTLVSQAQTAMNASMGPSANVSIATFATPYIVPRGGTSTLKMGHYGLSDWVVDSGTLFGDADVWDQTVNTKATSFDVDNYPEFKSYIHAVNGPLTENILDNRLAYFNDAYQSRLDTIVTTMGVTMKMLEAPNQGTSRMNYDRTGKSLVAKFGWDRIEYEWEGRSLTWHSSPFCPSGTLYGLKVGGGNMVRYVPPRAAPQGGAAAPGTNSEIGDEIEFIAPMGGGNNGSIFLHVRNTDSETTGQLEAPFWKLSQVAPIDVRSLKLTGLTESIATP